MMITHSQMVLHPASSTSSFGYSLGRSGTDTSRCWESTNNFLPLKSSVTLCFFTVFYLVVGLFLTCTHEWTLFVFVLHCEQSFPLGKSIITNPLELFKENGVLAGNLCAMFQLWRCGTPKVCRESRNADRLRTTAMTVCAAVLIWFTALRSRGFIIVHLNISEGS